MFTCAVCQKTIGPKVKPIRVITGVRHVEYHNEYIREDEYGNKKTFTVDSTGTEITGEEFVCAADGPQMGAEAPIQRTAPVTFRPGKVVFQEVPALPLRVKLIAEAVQHALTQVKRMEDGKASKRDELDMQVSIPLIKHFSDTNKDYKF